MRAVTRMKRKNLQYQEVQNGPVPVARLIIIVFRFLICVVSTIYINRIWKKRDLNDQNVIEYDNIEYCFNVIILLYIYICALLNNATTFFF